MSETYYCEACPFGPCTVSVMNPGHHTPDCCVMGHGLDPEWERTEAAEKGTWGCESCGSTEWQVSSINNPLREVVMCSSCGWHKEDSL